MYTYSTFSRRLYQTYISSSCSRRNRYISLFSPSWQRFLKITFNHPSASINLVRSLYTSNIHYQKTGSAVLCENRMAEKMGEKLKIDYNQLKKDQNDSNVLIIDVREPSEIKETGALPGSVHIPMNDVKNALENLTDMEFKIKYGTAKPKKDTKIVLSCRSGRRSECTQEIVQGLQYTKVYNYAGGWLDWEENFEKERKEEKERINEEEKQRSAKREEEKRKAEEKETE